MCADVKYSCRSSKAQLSVKNNNLLAVKDSEVRVLLVIIESLIMGLRVNDIGLNKQKSVSFTELLWVVY